MSTDYLCLLDKRARGSEVVGEEGVAMALTEGGPGQGRWREQGSTPPHESIICPVYNYTLYVLAREMSPLILHALRTYMYVDHTFHTVMFLLHHKFFPHFQDCFSIMKPIMFVTLR